MLKKILAVHNILGTLQLEIQLKDLGLENLDHNVDIRLICPILNPLPPANRSASHWKSNNASKDTFFENKHGENILDCAQSGTF